MDTDKNLDYYIYRLLDRHKTDYYNGLYQIQVFKISAATVKIGTSLNFSTAWVNLWLGFIFGLSKQTGPPK